MKQFTRRVRPRWRAFFDVRGLVAISGIILSIVLHEAFHIVLHWGSVTHVQLFPDHHAIVAVTSTTRVGYDPLLEEVVAYAVTLLMILVTTAVIARISDKKDTRTVVDTLFPKNSRMQRMSQQEFFELASRVNLL